MNDHLKNPFLPFELYHSDDVVHVSITTRNNFFRIKRKHSFKIQPLTCATAKLFSKTIKTIDPETLKRPVSEILLQDDKSIPTLVRCVAIALQNNGKEPQKKLIDLLMWEISLKQFLDLIGLCISKLGTEFSFITNSFLYCKRAEVLLAGRPEYQSN